MEAANQEVEASAFPSLLATDPVEEAVRLRGASLQHLEQLALCLRTLSALSPELQHELRIHLDRLESLESFLDGKAQKRSRDFLSMPPERIQKLAADLRERRQMLRLSTNQLAKRVGLSEGTIKRVEKGLDAPSRTTLLQLASLSELELDLHDLLYEARTKEGLGSSLNCYIAPGFDPVKMVIDLGKQLNGPGGYVEQTNVYLDHQSAAAYLHMANEPSYVSAFRSCIPLQLVANRLVEVTGGAGLDVIALGPGDAHEEVRLVQQIIGHTKRPDLRLYLLEISQPLLTEGFRHAADTLNDTYGVAYFGMQGNFHQLPKYAQLHYTPARSHRRRVICMLGRTMANLDDELRFFRFSLVGCAPRDLLLVDMQLGYAPADSPELIRKLDPALTKPMGDSSVAWLGGPIRRHCEGVSDIKFHLELNTRCPVPGSYELAAMATVSFLGKQPKQFSMNRTRRYEPKQFSESLASIGWQLVADFRYGGDRAPAAVMLFQKK